MMSENRPFLPNPLLGSLIGLCPIIVISSNFATGVALGLGLFLSMVILGAVLPAIRRFFPERLRAPLSFALAATLAALYYVAIEAYSPIIASLSGVFLPLIAVNCLMLTTLRHGIRSNESLIPWVLPSALVYFVTILFISAFREIAGCGSLTLPLPGILARSIPIFSVPPLRLFAAPSGGFIFLGFLVALYRAILRFQGRRIG